MHGAAARRVGHTDVPDDLLSSRARLAKQCFPSGCAGPPRTLAEQCSASRKAELCGTAQLASVLLCWRHPAAMPGFADGPRLTSCQPLRPSRSSAPRPAKRSFAGPGLTSGICHHGARRLRDDRLLGAHLQISSAVAWLRSRSSACLRSPCR